MKTLTMSLLVVNLIKDGLTRIEDTNHSMFASDEMLRKKFNQVADYLDVYTVDIDATVDRNNTPTFNAYGRFTKDAMFSKKFDEIKDYVEVCCEETHHMVNDLIGKGVIRSQLVEKVMRDVDKKEFAPMDPLNKGHYDYPIDIGYGTLMEPPHQIAGTLEYLKHYLRFGKKVLEIGAGTGYMSTLFTEMGATVYAMEHVPELCKDMKDKVFNIAPKAIWLKRLKIICADGRNGYPEQAPYDVIYISGVVTELPRNMMLQLKPNGVLLVTFKKQNGEYVLQAVHRVANTTSTEVKDVYLKAHNLTPLTDLQDQLKTL